MTPPGKEGRSQAGVQRRTPAGDVWLGTGTVTRALAPLQKAGQDWGCL